jgi:uroporphyrinogen decarboxylase
MSQLTPRQKFIDALERKPIEGLVPHFELEFFLTMEAFGRIHPQQRRYSQWKQMSESERDLHRRDIADLHVAILRRFGLAGKTYNSAQGWEEDDTRRSLEHFRELSGMDYFTSVHGGATYGLPNGSRMMEFVTKLADEPQEMKDNAQRMVDNAIVRAERLKTWGTLDGFCVCTDYCFNDNPFLSPAMFDEFVTPYMNQLFAAYRGMGFYTILHTDGNIMPILDRLVGAKPHAIQSLDPQGGVDIAEVKRLVGDKVCLIGNVHCGLLQTGTEEQVIESCRYALKHGMPNYGYVFSTSNCIYTGMPLERYELMQKVWREEGVYEPAVAPSPR